MNFRPGWEYFNPGMNSTFIGGPNHHLKGGHPPPPPPFYPPPPDFHPPPSFHQYGGHHNQRNHHNFWMQMQPKTEISMISPMDHAGVENGGVGGGPSGGGQYIPDESAAFYHPSESQQQQHPQYPQHPSQHPSYHHPPPPQHYSHHRSGGFGSGGGQHQTNHPPESAVKKKRGHPDHSLIAPSPVGVSSSSSTSISSSNNRHHHSGKPVPASASTASAPYASDGGRSVGGSQQYQHQQDQFRYQNHHRDNNKQTQQCISYHHQQQQSCQNIPYHHDLSAGAAGPASAAAPPPANPYYDDQSPTTRPAANYHYGNNNHPPPTPRRIRSSSDLPPSQKNQLPPPQNNSNNRVNGGGSADPHRPPPTHYNSYQNPYDLTAIQHNYSSSAAARPPTTTKANNENWKSNGGKPMKEEVGVVGMNHQGGTTNKNTGRLAEIISQEMTLDFSSQKLSKSSYNTPKGKLQQHHRFPSSIPSSSTTTSHVTTSLQSKPPNRSDSPRPKNNKEQTSKSRPTMDCCQQPERPAPVESSAYRQTTTTTAGGTNKTNKFKTPVPPAVVSHSSAGGGLAAEDRALSSCSSSGGGDGEGARNKKITVISLDSPPLSPTRALVKAAGTSSAAGNSRRTSSRTSGERRGGVISPAIKRAGDQQPAVKTHAVGPDQNTKREGKEVKKETQPPAPPARPRSSTPPLIIDIDSLDNVSPQKLIIIEDNLIDKKPEIVQEAEACQMCIELFGDQDRMAGRLYSDKEERSSHAQRHARQMDKPVPETISQCFPQSCPPSLSSVQPQKPVYQTSPSKGRQLHTSAVANNSEQSTVNTAHPTTANRGGTSLGTMMSASATYDNDNSMTNSTSVAAPATSTTVADGPSKDRHRKSESARKTPENGSSTSQPRPASRSSKGGRSASRNHGKQQIVIEDNNQSDGERTSSTYRETGGGKAAVPEILRNAKNCVVDMSSAAVEIARMAAEQQLKEELNLISDKVDCLEPPIHLLAHLSILTGGKESGPSSEIDSVRCSLCQTNVGKSADDILDDLYDHADLPLYTCEPCGHRSIRRSPAEHFRFKHPKEKIAVMDFRFQAQDELIKVLWKMFPEQIRPKPLDLGLKHSNKNQVVQCAKCNLTVEVSKDQRAIEKHLFDHTTLDIQSPSVEFRSPAYRCKLCPEYSGNDIVAHSIEKHFRLLFLSSAPADMMIVDGSIIKPDSWFRFTDLRPSHSSLEDLRQMIILSHDTAGDTVTDCATKSRQPPAGAGAGTTRTNSEEKGQQIDSTPLKFLALADILKNRKISRFSHQRCQAAECSWSVDMAKTDEAAGNPFAQHVYDHLKKHCLYKCKRCNKKLKRSPSLHYTDKHSGYNGTPQFYDLRGEIESELLSKLTECFPDIGYSRFLYLYKYNKSVYDLLSDALTAYQKNQRCNFGDKCDTSSIPTIQSTHDIEQHALGHLPHESQEGIFACSHCSFTGPDILRHSIYTHFHPPETTSTMVDSNSSGDGGGKLSRWFSYTDSRRNLKSELMEMVKKCFLVNVIIGDSNGDQQQQKDQQQRRDGKESGREGGSLTTSAGQKRLASNDDTESPPRNTAETTPPKKKKSKLADNNGGDQVPTTTTTNQRTSDPPENDNQSSPMSATNTGGNKTPSSQGTLAEPILEIVESPQKSSNNEAAGSTKTNQPCSDEKKVVGNGIAAGRRGSKSPVDMNNNNNNNQQEENDEILIDFEGKAPGGLEEKATGGAGGYGRKRKRTGGGGQKGTERKMPLNRTLDQSLESLLNDEDPVETANNTSYQKNPPPIRFLNYVAVLVEYIEGQLNGLMPQCGLMTTRSAGGNGSGGVGGSPCSFDEEKIDGTTAEFVENHVMSHCKSQEFFQCSRCGIKFSEYDSDHTHDDTSPSSVESGGDGFEKCIAAAAGEDKKTKSTLVDLRSAQEDELVRLTLKCYPMLFKFKFWFGHASRTKLCKAVLKIVKKLKEESRSSVTCRQWKEKLTFGGRAPVPDAVSSSAASRFENGGVQLELLHHALEHFDGTVDQSTQSTAFTCRVCRYNGTRIIQHVMNEHQLTVGVTRFADIVSDNLVRYDRQLERVLASCFEKEIWSEL